MLRPVLVSIALVVVAGASCATAPAPAPPPAEPAPPAPAPPSAEPAPPAPAPEPAPAPAPALPDPALPLAWVNPARCLDPCGFDPSESVVSINDRGELAAAGPFRVERTTQAALLLLLAAARAAGHELGVLSAYRSYAEQVRVFRTIKEKGRAARPGHSEHQLGTTVDLRLPTSAAADWLAANATAHGFAVSYPAGKQRLTGYRPEPWHVRFVGPTIAGELAQKGICLEELFRSQPELGQSGSCSDCPAKISRAACGKVTEAGRCQGSVLTWCYEGALASVDCASSEEICARAPDTGLAACVPRLQASAP